MDVFQIGAHLAKIIGTYLNVLFSILINELKLITNLQFIISIVAIIVFGFIAGRLLKFIIVKILVTTGIRRMTQNAWINEFLKISGYKKDVVELIGDIVKWAIYILAITLILQAFGLSSISFVSAEIINLIPRFIFSVLLLIVGFLIADFFGKAFEEAALKFFGDEGVGKLSGGVAKYSIAMASLTLALALLGFDVSALLILLVALIGVVILMLYISFKDVLPEFSAGFSARQLIKIGDKVVIGEYKGRVERFEPFSIVLKNGNKIVRIPNTFLIKRPVIKIEK
ncbi:MAG TPA: mechanosensitive ion channel [Candidatus Aenigmarchaeota archaeon]|nr:MAG: hypothetical protein DRP03_01545 [Candidatus Aenigmarchaeota archaeon]HDD46532.1 mechanosensitive ion channel [Candidatus Aenigmarchaeota archaeon]